MKQRIVLSNLAFLSTIFLSSSLHASEFINSSDYYKNLTTIQPHTRSMAVNERHAAECAEMGGVDVTDKHVLLTGHDVKDMYVCEIKDKQKLLNNKPEFKTTKINEDKTFTDAPSGYIESGSFIATGLASVFVGDTFNRFTPILGMDIGGMRIGDSVDQATYLLCSGLVYGPEVSYVSPKALFTVTLKCRGSSGRKTSRTHIDALIDNRVYIDLALGFGTVVQPDNEDEASPEKNIGDNENPSCNMPSSYVANPINVSIGDKYQVEEDISGSGAYPLNFIRYYNSVDGLWRHNYSAKFVDLYYPMSTIMFENGKEIRVYHTGKKDYHLEPTALGSFAITQFGYRYTTPFNEVYNFDVSGALISRVSSNGMIHSVKRISNSELIVSDEYGHSLTITETPYGQPISVVSSDGQKVTYEYDKLRRLIEVTKNNKKKVFHYEDTKHLNELTGITDENGIRYATWSYDESGRAKSSYHNGDVEKVTIFYDNNLQSRMVNPLGRTYIYKYKIINGIKLITSITGNASSSCPYINTSYEYNNRGLVTLKTDGQDIKTSYSYNDLGQEIARTIGVGTSEALTITTTWDKRFNKPKTETYPDKVITYDYDNDGNLIDQNIEAK